MAHIESFSTAGLDPRRKLAFWNDRASESFSPLVCEPKDIRVFNGSIVRGTVGDMTLSEVYSDAQIVRHSRSHVARTKDSMFFLHLQLEGESVSRQDGRESVLRAGDFTLCDSTRRYEMIFTGAAYADLPQALADRSSLGTAHRIRIINFIEAHLNDPDLTPTRIAEACKMTARYLHHLFSDQDETVARYILRRRLEACSRALQSGAQRGRTVTAIAFDYGFNSPTHFGRVFRAKFNVTPREYRREKAGIT